MATATKSRSEVFQKKYNVSIDTGPLPEREAECIELVVDQITPVINQIVKDAMTVAIDTWPTPEKPR